jgi:hypothetical protein
MSPTPARVRIVVPTADAESAVLGALCIEGGDSDAILGAICGAPCLPPSVCRGRCATCACLGVQGLGAPQAVAFDDHK